MSNQGYYQGGPQYPQQRWAHPAVIDLEAPFTSHCFLMADMTSAILADFTLITAAMVVILPSKAIPLSRATTIKVLRYVPSVARSRHQPSALGLPQRSLTPSFYQQQMQYQQGPPQQVVVREKKDRGCLTAW